MQLSIVVPTYNVEAYLANCLESLLAQDLDPSTYEILVVNDGSTDRSPAIASEFEKKYPHVTVHHQPNQGLSAARNTGMALAKGKYLYFIDSDDYIARNTLGYVLRMMEKHQLDVLGLRSVNTESFDKKEAENREIMETEELVVSDGITYVADNNYLNNVWWYVINREYLQQSGLSFPVGRFVEDANFTAELLVNTRKMAKSRLDFYRYVIRQGSIMRKRSVAHNRKMIADYEKNVFDYEHLLVALRKKDHPKIADCLERLEARQQAFVFFLIVRCIKINMSPKELQEILSRFRNIEAYPMHRFIGRDYHLLKFRLLTRVLNNRILLNTSLLFSPVINKLLPLYPKA